MNAKHTHDDTKGLKSLLVLNKGEGLPFLQVPHTQTQACSYWKCHCNFSCQVGQLFTLPVQIPIRVQQLTFTISIFSTSKGKTTLSCLWRYVYFYSHSCNGFCASCQSWLRSGWKNVLKLLSGSLKDKVCILKKHHVINEFQSNVLFSMLRILSCKCFKVMIFSNLTEVNVQLFSCEGLHCAQLLQCGLLFLNMFALHNAIAFWITGFIQLILYELKRSIFQLSD